MTIFKLLYVLFLIALNIYVISMVITVIAANDISELRYRLRCAKELMQIIPPKPEYEEIAKKAKEEVEELEEKYRNHWGWKFAGNRNGTFDYLRTPYEDARWRKTFISTTKYVDK